MPGPGACSGPDQKLVDLPGRDNLVDERVDCGAATVDNALSANLDHGGIRQYPEVRGSVHRGHKLWIGERTLHKERFKLRRRVCHEGTSFRFSNRAPSASTLSPGLRTKAAAFSRPRLSGKRQQLYWTKDCDQDCHEASGGPSRRAIAVVRRVAAPPCPAHKDDGRLLVRGEQHVAVFRRSALVEPAHVLEPVPGVAKVLVAHLAVVAGDVDARVAPVEFRLVEAS